MRLITDIGNHASLPLCVATIGFFDGVHKGHRYLIDQVRTLALKEKKKSAIITFPVHPRKILQSDYQPELLSTLDEKIALLDSTCIDECFLLPFTPDISRLSAKKFMLQILKLQFNVSSLVIGYDHRFGHNRSEGFDDYVRYGEAMDIKVVLANALLTADSQISSSACRSLLLDGKVDKAAECLGYAYSITGIVVDGYKVGRTLGFPTANIKIGDSDKLLPGCGVYAVKVYLHGAVFRGMLNIGSRPTLENGDKPSIEVNILDFSGNIYQENLRVEFVSRLRDEIKFPSVESLALQLKEDEKTVRKAVNI